MVKTRHIRFLLPSVASISNCVNEKWISQKALTSYEGELWISFVSLPQGKLSDIGKH